MAELKQHWTQIHANKDKDVSWWQEDLWLDFLDFISISGSAIDVGSGQSPIAIALAHAGFNPVYVNDLAENALEKLVLSGSSAGAELIALPGSVLNINLPTDVKLWHDRAVFHFLTAESEIRDYKNKVLSSTCEGAYLVISTFSENGPDQCSSLNVHKYSPEELVAVFSPEFKELKTLKRVHKTPWDSEQEFSIAIMQKI